MHLRVHPSKDPAATHHHGANISTTNGGTHTNGHGDAQAHSWADYTSRANHWPDIEAIEAIEVQPGVVGTLHVKLRGVGTVAVKVAQLVDFGQFNEACVAQVLRCFDPPPTVAAWNRQVDTALHTAVRLPVDASALSPQSQEKSTGLSELEKAMTEALDQRRVEIEVNGNRVHAVRKNDVKARFKDAYLATHTGNVGLAWRRALNHPKATVTGNDDYLWKRSAP
jgi:hypothetical protein